MKSAGPTPSGGATEEPTGCEGGGKNEPTGGKPTAPTRPMETGEPTGEDTAVVTYEPMEEDPVKEPTLRPTSRPMQKPTIDDIGKGTDLAPIMLVSTFVVCLID